MSMYTQLLDAAYADHAPDEGRMTRGRAVAEVVRRRDELEESTPAWMEPDTVPAVLSLQIGYDVALLELARVMGVDTDPSRFDQPQRERDRLERAFNDLGLYLMRQLGERPSSRSV